MVQMGGAPIPSNDRIAAAPVAPLVPPVTSRAPSVAVVDDDGFSAGDSIRPSRTSVDAVAANSEANNYMTDAPPLPPLEHIGLGGVAILLQRAGEYSN